MTPEERIKAFIKLAKQDYLTADGDYIPSKKTGRYPDLYVGYADACAERENINIHSSKRAFPEMSFRRLLSNMDEEGINWLKENYQPITQSVFSDFDNTVKRATSNVYFDDNGVEQDVMEYLFEELPKYDNFQVLFTQIQPTVNLKDAMSVYCVGIDSLSTELNDAGEMVISDMVSPVVNFFECFRVLHYQRHEACLVLRPEKSVVKVGQTNRKSGLIFEYYDKERIIRFEQFDVRTEYKFQITMDFEHELGYMPAVRAGGIPEVIENNIVYSSFFSPALPHLNYALFDGILLQAQKRKSAFPTQVVASEPCNYEDGNGNYCNQGYIRGVNIETGKEFFERCNQCGGTGKTKRLNEFSTLYIPIPKEDENGKIAGLSVHDAMTYVTPSVEIMRFLREEVDQQLNAAYETIKTKRSNVDTGNVTATEKGIDLKATQAFMMSFTVGLINVGNYLLNAIVDMRWGVDARTKPSILKPQHLDFKTTADYIAEIAEAQKSGLPPFAMAKLISDMMYSMSDGSDISTRMVETVIAADTLFSIDGIKAQLQRENVEKWQLVLHLSSFTLIYDLINKDESYIERPLAERVQILIDAAKAITPTSEAAIIETI